MDERVWKPSFGERRGQILYPFNCRHINDFQPSQEEVPGLIINTHIRLDVWSSIPMKPKNGCFLNLCQMWGNFLLDPYDGWVCLVNELELAVLVEICEQNHCRFQKKNWRRRLSRSNPYKTQKSVPLKLVPHLGKFSLETPVEARFVL